MFCFVLCSVLRLFCLRCIFFCATRNEKTRKLKNIQKYNTTNKTDILSAAHYIKLIALKSLTMSDVKSLVSDSTDEEATQKNEKNFDCHLYGAKYYCSKNRANKVSIVFDLCQESSASGINTMARRRTVIESAAASIDGRKINDVQGLGGPTEIMKASSVTTTNLEKKHVAVKVKAGGKHQAVSHLRSIPHRNGFISIEGEGDCNGFYVDGKSQEQQNQLKHVFLRIYDKNKRIKLVQDCNRLHWPKMALTRAFSPKIYHSIPFFIVLMEFLFDNMKQDTLHYNYMSLMESIHCLLLFKDYHKEENRKRDNRHGNNNSDSIDVEFEQCNILLNKKLMKLNNEMQDFGVNGPVVVFFFFFSFFFFFLTLVLCKDLHTC